MTVVVRAQMSIPAPAVAVSSTRNTRIKAVLRSLFAAASVKKVQ